MTDPRHAALVITVGSWTAVAAAYLVSVAEGSVPGCVPHLLGCTSISAAARYGSAFYLFKAIMLPVAALAIVYWATCYRWLAAIRSTPSAVDRGMLALGIFGAVALLVHVTCLGIELDGARTLRRIGTIGYFVGTFVGEALLTLRLRRLGQRSPVLDLKWALCLAIPGVSIALALVAAGLEDDAYIENASEWNAATLLAALPGLTWVLLRREADSRVAVDVARS